MCLAGASLAAGVAISAWGGVPGTDIGEPSAVATKGATSRAAGAASMSVQSKLVYELKAGDAASLAAWSDRSVESAAPHGVLGRFHNSKVTLSLKGLPAHAFVRLKVDLLVIDSWDGADSGGGPDQLRIGLDDSRLLMQATFNNNKEGLQSFPDNSPAEGSPSCAGATAIDLAWAPHSKHDWTTHTSALYKLEYAFPHTADAIQVDFQGSLREQDSRASNLDNESWALAGVQVETLGGPPVVLEGDAFQDLLSKLSSRDALEADGAFRRLIAAGDAVADLYDRFGAISSDEEKVRGFFSKLDDDDYQVREKATLALIEVGDSVYDQCRSMRRGAVSEEVASRLDRIIAEIRKGKPAGDVQLMRFRRALEIVGTPRALKLAGKLPTLPPPSALVPLDD